MHRFGMAITSALILTLLAGTDTAASSELGGIGYSRVNVDVKQENPYEDNLEWRNKLFVELRGEPRENILAVFSALAEHNTLSGRRTRAEYTLGLYEGYVRFRWGMFDLFAGKQVVDWGVADVSILDNLNPRNLEEFVAREEEFAKIPQLMLRGVYLLDNGSLEAAYVPFYVPSYMPLFGSDWAMLNNQALGDYEGEMDADTFLAQGAKPGIDDYPAYNFVNGTVAGRWTHSGDWGDYQLSVFNGWELFPLFEFNRDFVNYLAQQPEGARKTLEGLTPQEVIAYAPLYRSRPIRQTQVGGGFSGYLGESTVRGELAVIHPQELYTTDFELTEHTVVAGTLGIDRFLPLGIYGNVSYLGAYVGDYPDEGLFLLQRYNHYVIAFLRASLFDAWVTPEIRAVVNLGQGDSYLSPRVAFRLMDNTQLSVGAHLLNGPQDTIFGQMSDNSFVFTQLRYAF
jgi:hypothetical protein